MSADPLDIAADRAEHERETAIRRHLQRADRPRSLCESCGENPVHVTTNGTHWRFCAECADDHLRLVREGQTA
ncbi:hypothetical protein [Lysobacter sp. HA35]